MQCCVCVAGWGAAYCTYLTSRGLSIADNLDLVSCEIINDVRKKKEKHKQIKHICILFMKHLTVDTFTFLVHKHSE